MSLEFSGGTKENPDCIKLLPHIFPELKYLFVGGHLLALEDAVQELDMSFFMPLIAFDKLERLGLVFINGFTTAGLAMLCNSLPQLKRLMYMPFVKVDVNKIVAEIEAKGRRISITAG